LLRFDVESGEPRRNGDGFCERCQPDEPGEAVCLIPAGTELAGRFEGYADPEATARKILRNVFKQGDAWYRTGDLMRRDQGGFYYFVDRVGETFRWKGENVSTAEVLTALMASSGVRDGVVYGVAVPGADGRAGAAALVVDAQFELATFRTDVALRLPAYARPVFLRLIQQVDSTSTFKPCKQDLIEQGFDPGRIADPLYFSDPRTEAYVPLDAALFAAISAGSLRI
jgi:fatty-acyl-CoA synthase